jgi:hypothetical protein
MRNVAMWIVRRLVGKLVTKDHAKEILLLVGDKLTNAAAATGTDLDDKAVKLLRDSVDEDALAELIEGVLGK